MRLQTLQRLSSLSFVVLLSLSIAGTVLVHQVSPLRDPAFQPNSGNAGSLLPTFRTVRESDWITGATILAALLALSLTLMLFLGWYQRSMTTPPRLQTQGVLRRTMQFLLWVSFGLLTFTGVWISWMVYLMTQWLVD